MAMFVLPLILIVVLAAVVFGCWWLIPTVLAVAAVIVAGYYAWRWAGRITTVTPGGFTAWWTANRSRVLWAMSIFVSIVLAGVIVWCLVRQFAPACTGGCLSRSVATSNATPAPTTAPKQTREFDLAVGADEWSEEIPVPLDGNLRWAADDRKRYRVQSSSGEMVNYPRAGDEYFQLSPGGKVRFRSLEAGPIVIRVKMTR